MLLGWITGAVALQRLAPGLATTNADTAFGVLLLSAAWVLPARAAIACRWIAATIATLTLLEYTTATNVGIDQLLFADHGGGAHPGRPSVIAAGGILLLAASHLPLLSGRVMAQVLAVATGATSLLGLLGHLYGVNALDRLDGYSSVAWYWVAVLLLLSLARLAAVPDGGVQWLVIGGDRGALLLRFLLVLGLVAQPVIGWVTIFFARRGWVTGSASVAMLSLLCVLSIGSVAWIASLRLGRTDRARARLLGELTELTAGLERQVAERAELLQANATEIAVLEDRQRIAADLHDIVIQRLFAAGMTLQAGASDNDDASRRTRMLSASEEMDLAIKDLRASIFELHGRTVVTVPLPDAIEAVAREATRILGFAPDVVIDDPDERAELVRDDLLAVVREGLSNVARHAKATQVCVEIRTDGSTIKLNVIDDGVGIGSPTHSSGTDNIARRAVQLGGESSWNPVVPHGTSLSWIVPDPGAPEPVVVEQRDVLEPLRNHA